MIEELCPWCGEPADDMEPTEERGHIDADGRHSLRVMHMACSLRSLVGSVGHQRRTCSCFGGTEEDPPGLSKREAARAALIEFRSRKPLQGAPKKVAVWLSFCERARKVGDRFLGACIVRVDDSDDGRAVLRDAIQEAWRLGCNPGGECALIGGLNNDIVPDEWVGRLLTRAQCEEFDTIVGKHYPKKGDREN